jgi:uncharacterized protein (TIGR00369 family)
MTFEPATPETAPYPPEHHLLRDLRFHFEHNSDGRRSRAWMPIVPEVCTDQGHARAGVLATLVDVIGGGLAAGAAAPGWIATADLTLHLVRGAAPGAVVEARGEVLRSGRTTVVMEVVLVDQHERRLGDASMSFSVLPRRESNPDISSVRSVGPSTMATESAGMKQPLADALGIVVRDPDAGVLDVPVTDWTRNSMGAMQGGVVATIADFAAETALRAATTEPLVVADMQVTYLGFGRTGPVRSCVDVLGTEAGRGVARIVLDDAGAGHRRMTRATAVAVRGQS